MMLLRTDCHVTWWWKDPLPSLVIYGRFLKSLFSKPKVARHQDATGRTTDTQLSRIAKVRDGIELRSKIR